jgi:hypothetical protein
MYETTVKEDNRAGDFTRQKGLLVLCAGEKNNAQRIKTGGREGKHHE